MFAHAFYKTTEHTEYIARRSRTQNHDGNAECGMRNAECGMLNVQEIHEKYC